jgi:ribosomal subunit interface protein
MALKGRKNPGKGTSMNITIKGKHVDLGEALQTYVNEGLSETTGKYFPSAMEGAVVFSKDRYNYVADIQIHIGRGLNVQAQGEATEPYPAFDQALEKLQGRLRRHKGRLQNHHKVAPRDVGGVMAAKTFVIDAEAEEKMEGVDPDGQPVIIADMETGIETLSVGEAVMRLDLGDLPALMFRSRKHGGMSMVYRRADGNIGWVDPEVAGKGA